MPPRQVVRGLVAGALSFALLAVAGCSSTRSASSEPDGSPTVKGTSSLRASAPLDTGSGTSALRAPQFRDPLPGMPRVLADNVYAGTRAGHLAPRVRHDPALVYVQDDVIRFADPHTFAKRHDVRDPACRGPNHADFSANGRFLVVSCEFSRALMKISTITHRVLGVIRLQTGSMPQDVRLSPDGRTFYVANMGLARVERVSALGFHLLRSIPTPAGPHGLYPSRDGRLLYVSDRAAGKVSVVSFRTDRVIDTWNVPGGSPDMGGVSADGRVLWLSGRYNSEVYAISTRTGRLLARIPVPGSPHGLCVWPQPGRYSLGHTGNMR